MRVRLLHCMRVPLHNGYMPAYAQIMQHTHMHKAVTRRVEAKKLLSRPRQSNYRNGTSVTTHPDPPYRLTTQVTYSVIPLRLLQVWSNVEGTLQLLHGQ